MKQGLVIALVVGLGAAVPTIAMDCARTASSLGAGPSEGVAVVGNLTVIGAGSLVVTFDTTDPAHPERLGDTEVDGSVDPVGAIGDLALAFVYGPLSNRLSVIDPNPQGSPREISSMALPDRVRPNDLVVVDSTAWITTSSLGHGLLGVDLTDPETPYLMQIMELPGTAESIAAIGDRVLMASRHAGLMIVDVTDPTDPSLSGSLEIPNAAAITATTEYAYVAAFGGSGGSAVHVVDIIEPAAPVMVSSAPYAQVAWPRDLAIMDDRLFLGLIDLDPMIALPEGGFIVFDISNPIDPIEIDSARFSSGPKRFVPTGNTITAADHERGLRIFRAGSAGFTEIARRNPTLDDAYSIAVEGDNAYLGDQGLRVINIADHSHPVELGSVELGGEMIAVAAGGDGARVAILAWGGELTLIDTLDPTQPVVGSTLATQGVDVSISDTIVAVAEDHQGVALFDITDLETPTLLAQISTSGRALAVALNAGIAVIGLGMNGVVEGAVAVYDISDPTDPILRSQTPTPGWVYAVDAIDSKAALLSPDSVRLIDISDPAAPVELGSSDARLGIAEDVAIGGNLVHVSSWSGSLHVIDFSDPGSPSVRARTTWDPFGIMDGGPQGGYGVSLHNGAAVIADGRYGLRVVSIGRCRPVPGAERSSAAVD